MRENLLNKPYKFIPPHRGSIWPRLLQVVLPTSLKKTYGVVKVECIGVERLRRSIDSGAGVMLAPNHCRPCDPMILAMLSRCLQQPFFTMASAHLFYRSWFSRWLLTRAGAFSIYREGLDRAALEMAIEILALGERPLVVFPEGVISRTNDRLNSLMEGVGTIARAAARRRAKLNCATGETSSSIKNSKQIAVHPVAIRYFFHGQLEKSIDPVLRELERRLTWLPEDVSNQTAVSASSLSPMIERVQRIGRALVALKEIEYLGSPQEGSFAERLQGLVDAIIVPIEEQLLKGRQSGSTVARVKKLRTVIMPDLLKGELSEQDAENKWRQLRKLNYAQQISHYPADYLLAEDVAAERLLETVERFEEDLSNGSRIHRPMSAVIEVAEPMIVEQDVNADDSANLTAGIQESISQSLEQLRLQRPVL